MGMKSASQTEDVFTDVEETDVDEPTFENDPVEPDEDSDQGQPTSHILQRAIVLERMRIFYVPVPKAGCTSLLWSLAGLAGLPESAFADSEGREVTRALAIHDVKRWPSSFRFGERSAEDRDHVLHDDDWLRFTVARDPFRRLWSAWQSKILLAEPQFTSRYSSLPWFPTNLGSADDVLRAWREFLTALQADSDLLRADVHWAPQVDVLDYPTVSYDHVGHVEKLGETLDRVRDHLRVNAEADLPEPSRTNLSTLPYADELFTEDSVRFLSEMYVDDMRAFGYEPPQGDGVGGTIPDSWTAAVEAVVPAIEELRNRHERVADLQQILRARRQRVREMERLNKREQKLRREEHRRNERLRKRLRAESAELQKMRNARTWRYTAPIRRVSSRLRRIKRVLRGKR